ncbi:MAG TPA: KTSC domain-containing protein [Solirubrobacterales bacterium]|nr:KTSC domain-containing protein [Solirubrobacterales bacterium]
MPTPEMHPVESSAIARIGYDAEAEEAYVEYLGGGLYAYAGVPAEVFEELTEADSKGTFVNAVIKEYPFRRVQ